MKQNVIDDYNLLSGQQKAAILMMSLEEDKSAALFALMDDEEIKELSVIMASLGKVNSNVVEQLFAEFSEKLNSAGTLIGTYETTERLLSKSMDKDRVAALALRLRYEREAQRGFAGGFRPVNFDYPSARQAADAERQIYGHRTRADRFDLHFCGVAQPYEGTLPELLVDHAERHFKRLVRRLVYLCRWNFFCHIFYFIKLLPVAKFLLRISGLNACRNAARKRFFLKMKARFFYPKNKMLSIIYFFADPKIYSGVGGRNAALFQVAAARIPESGVFARGGL